MKWEIKAYSRPAMLAREMKIPELEMIFSGRTLKEVMPSTAKCSIFQRVFGLSLKRVPGHRLRRCFSKPISGTIPRRRG